MNSWFMHVYFHETKHSFIIPVIMTDIGTIIHRDYCNREYCSYCQHIALQQFWDFTRANRPSLYKYAIRNCNVKTSGFVGFSSIC